MRCAREISFFHSLYHNVRRKVMELCWNRRKGASKYQQWLWLEYKPKIFVFVFIHRQRDLWGIRWHADVDVKWALSGQHGNRKEKEINVHVDEHVKWSRISRWNGQCIYSSRVGVAIDGINTDKSGYPWKKMPILSALSVQFHPFDYHTSFQFCCPYLPTISSTNKSPPQNYHNFPLLPTLSSSSPQSPIYQLPALLAN